MFTFGKGAKSYIIKNVQELAHCLLYSLYNLKIFLIMFPKNFGNLITTILINTTAFLLFITPFTDYVKSFAPPVPSHTYEANACQGY